MVMTLLDDKTINLIVQQETERINNSHWADLTLEEIGQIGDKEKRNEARRQFKRCLVCVINPLYTGIKNKSKFEFSNPNELLTCRTMMKDLMNYYYNKGFTREEIVKIATDKDIRKRY